MTSPAYLCFIEPPVTNTPQGVSPHTCGTTPGPFPNKQTIGSALKFQRARQQERARTQPEPCPSSSTSYRTVLIVQWGNVNHLQDAGIALESSHVQRTSAVIARGNRLRVQLPRDSLLIEVPARSRYLIRCLKSRNRYIKSI